MESSFVALNHQQAAFEEITARARAYFSGHWRGMPIRARWHSLLCGPTGTGKTAVAQLAAQAVDASLLRLSAPGWMPLGAHQRGAKETITVIAEHVFRSERTFLVVDEIDKLLPGWGGAKGSGGGSQGESWQSYIRGEIYDLTDVRWPTGLRLPEDDEWNEISMEELTQKLQESVFILGIGTFQDWFDTEGTRRSMGFNADPTQAPKEITADAVCERLPRELANRFNADLIRLPQLQADDYRRIATETESKLPAELRQPFSAEVNRRMETAIQTRKGVRFLEECLMAVLKTLPPAPIPERPPAAQPVTLEPG